MLISPDHVFKKVTFPSPYMVLLTNKSKMAASADRGGHEFDSTISVKRRKTDPERTVCEELLKLEEDLCQELSSLNFLSPVSFVYNPLEYAKETHEVYVRKYCKAGQNVLFLGMNPGPFGMAQNGVS